MTEIGTADLSNIDTNKEKPFADEQCSRYAILCRREALKSFSMGFQQRPSDRVETSIYKSR